MRYRPNSYSYSYITAGCTDGNTYVWDTSQGDKPIHILRHGEPIEEYRGEREREDVGVKFTAWGNTPDRFYTGSSDGVVKVWNVRSMSKPLVRDLLEVPSAVSYGMFSPDRSKLVVGDATGRVFLLSLDDLESNDGATRKKTGAAPTSSFMSLKLPNGTTKTIRRPKLLIPHPEPEPPLVDGQGRLVASGSGRERARAYLAAQELVRHPNPLVGAVKGPNYAATGLYRREAYPDNDPSSGQLLAEWDMKQLDSGSRNLPSRDRSLRIGRLRELEGGVAQQHERNALRDFDVEGLAEDDRLQLEEEGADLSPDYFLDEAEPEFWALL